MLRNLFATMFLVVLMLTTAACSTPKEKFYSDKGNVRSGYCVEELNSAFTDALRNSDEFDSEIEDSFVTVGYMHGNCYANFNVLTTEGNYLSFKIKDSLRIYKMSDPMIPEHDRIHEPVGEYRLVDGILERKL